jgi:hypothetical protein
MAFEGIFRSKSKIFIPLPGGRDPYLTGRGCRATPQMAFLQDHYYYILNLPIKE